MDYYSNMTPEKFETFCRQLFKANNLKDVSSLYFQSISLYGINPDFIVMNPEGKKIVVETKRVRDTNALKDAIMILASYVSLLKVSKAILISPQKISPSLFEIARPLNIEIWDEERIFEIIQSSPNNFFTLKNELYLPGQIKLKSVTINNLRGIRNLTLNLSSTTVLVGKNGAGKSTILDGIAFTLSWFCRRMINPNSSGSSIQENDITNSEPESRIHIVTDIEGEEVDWEIISARSGYSQPQRSKYRGLTNKIRNMQDNAFIDPKIPLPTIVYYSIHRAVNQVPIDGPTHTEANRYKDLYGDAISGDRQDFKGFFEWFRKQEDIENQKRSEGDISFRDHQLAAVRNAVLKILDGFSDLKIQRTEKTTVMVAVKDSQTLEINQLSDGEKCVIGMVGDLARRLSIANPSMENPLNGYGVVLIDEIELHLHPQLQRAVIPFLTSTFPKCQFIISTHSAPIISHINIFPVFLLENSNAGIQTHELHPYGQDVIRLLNNVFGTEGRPPEIQQDLAKCAELIDNDKLDQAQELLDDISSRIDKNDPEITRLQTELYFLKN